MMLYDVPTSFNRLTHLNLHNNLVYISEELEYKQLGLPESHSQ